MLGVVAADDAHVVVDLEDAVGVGLEEQVDGANVAGPIVEAIPRRVDP